jgi:hypothetical protein
VIGVAVLGESLARKKDFYDKRKSTVNVIGDFCEKVGVIELFVDFYFAKK